MTISKFMAKEIQQESVFKQFYGRDRRLYYNKALCELQMGLFDQAISTCKQYLQPIKRVTRKVVQLENQAWYTKEQDDINEDRHFDEILQPNAVKSRRDEEQLAEHR